MKNLLQFEFRKLTRKKSVYICTTVSFVLLFLMTLFTEIIFSLTQETYQAFDVLLDGVNSGSFTLLAGIFAILFMCEDYSRQTVKNIYARGYSHTCVYFAKMIATLVAASAMYLALELFAFALGALAYGVGEVESAKYFAVLAVQYVAAMAEVLFAFFIASVLCKNGASIATYVLSPIAASLVLSLLELLLKLKKINLNNYWVSGFLGDLSLSVSTERLLECLFGSLIYIAVFVFVGMFFNKRIKL